MCIASSFVEADMMNHLQMDHLAEMNPYQSVSKIVSHAIESEDNRRYVGVKDVEQIPETLIENLEHTGRYRLHTLDRHSYGGRAVDLNIKNPITGRPMTGSSSGTAVNVLCGINDIGIGTDGGGSVLAPAMSTNLFGLISPLIERDYLNHYLKVSTDGIEFSPSIGAMTSEYRTLVSFAKDCGILQQAVDHPKIMVNKIDPAVSDFSCIPVEFPDIYGPRKECIEFLVKTLPVCDFIISREGPVDLLGFGDTVFGHLGGTAQKIQRNGFKGLIRTANMADASAVCIPTEDLGCAYVLICESESDKIASMLQYAERLVPTEDRLISRFFRSYETYVSKGYGKD